MAITEIRSLRATRITEALGEKGKVQVTASEELLVVCDSANPDFASIGENTSPYAPYNAPVPKIGLRISYGGYSLVCSNRQWSYYEDNERLVKVVVEYTAISEDQEEPEKPQEGDAETWQSMSLESYSIEKPARGWVDREEVGTIELGMIDDIRTAAYNTAGDVVDGLTMQTAGLRMIYNNTNVSDPDFLKLFEYVNTVNDGKWLGADDYTVRVAGYRADYDQKNQAWAVSVEFVYDPAGQQLRFLNAGYNERISGDRKAILDKSGNPVTKPVPLAEDGTAMPLMTGGGSVPFTLPLVERELYPYAAKNFDNLFSDCRI
jgi:hypothetical protein